MSLHTPSPSDTTDVAGSSNAGVSPTEVDDSVEEHQLFEIKRSMDKDKRQTGDDEVEERPATPDPRLEPPRSVFSKRTKWLVVGLSAFAGLFSPISSQVFVPAIPQLVEAFQVSTEKINLSLTVYLIFQAVTPSFFGSLSDTWGRRPVYISTLSIYVGACIGLAVMPTSAYWLLLVLRILQATGGSAVIAIGSGCVADVAEASERGTYMGLFQSVSLIGPALGPLFGGAIAERASWRWIFWFLAIWCSVCLILMFFVFPETLRSIVGDGSIAPPAVNALPLDLLRRRKAARAASARGDEKVHVERPPRKSFAPLASFRMLFYPDLACLLLFTSTAYALFYAVLTVYSSLLANDYHYSEVIIGICYLPNGLGSIVCALSIGRFLDWDYRRQKAKRGVDPNMRHVPDDFPIHKVRLRLMPYFCAGYIVILIAFGWAMQAKTSIAVSLITNFGVGMGGVGMMSITSVLSVDLFPEQAGAVTASFNLVRCLFGAAATAFIDPMIKSRLQTGWTFVVLSAALAALFPLILLLRRYGPKWREERRVALAHAAEKKQAKDDKARTRTPG